MTEETRPIAPSFVAGRSREKRIELEWPIEYGGTIYDVITLRRLTVAEVSAFVESVKDLPDGKKFHWPLFFDDAGAPVPPAVMDALDADDSERLDSEALDFLPRRFRGGPEADHRAPRSEAQSVAAQTDSAPSAGATIEPSSSV